MTSTQIDNTYNDLVSSIDREFRRLKQVLAEQEIKEEEDRLKKIQVKIKNLIIIFSFILNIQKFRWNSNVKKIKKLQKKNV